MTHDAAMRIGIDWPILEYREDIYGLQENDRRPRMGSVGSRRSTRSYEEGSRTPTEGSHDTPLAHETASWSDSSHPFEFPHDEAERPTETPSSSDDDSPISEARHQAQPAIEASPPLVFFNQRHATVETDDESEGRPAEMPVRRESRPYLENVVREVIDQEVRILFQCEEQLSAGNRTVRTLAELDICILPLLGLVQPPAHAYFRLNGR